MATISSPHQASMPHAQDLLRLRGLSALTWIMAVAVVVRLLLLAWFWDRPIRIEDEADYHLIATNLASHGEFAYEFGMPTSLRPPLYPLLVAGVYKAFGQGNFAMVRFLQSLLSLGMVWLVFRLAETLYDRRVGLWAAGLVALYPSLLGFNDLILTETLFTTLLCASCLALVRARQSHSLVLAGVAGVMLGLGALARSVLWPTFLPLGIWLGLGWGRNARLKAVAVFIGAFWLTLAPWVIRNTRLEHSFQTVDTMGGRNFMMGNYEYTPSYRGWAVVGIEGPTNWFSVLTKTYPEALTSTQGKRDKLAFRYGVQYIAHHPLQTAMRDVIKFFDFWGLERELVAGAGQGYFGSMPLWALVLLSLIVFGSYAAGLFAGIFGIVIRPPSDRWAHGLLLLVLALICGVHSITFGHSRYHLPLMPLVLIYAAAAVNGLPQIVAIRRPAFWLAIGLCGVFVVAWTVGILGPDSDRFVRLLHGSS